MSPISHIARSVMMLAILSLGIFTFATGVHADIPSAAADSGISRNTLQARKYLADAQRALKNEDFPLATIELKNALRWDPNNSTLHTLLGVALLQDNEVIPAEHELRQARLYGAKDQDVLPPLLQCMIVLREWQDVLDQFANPAPSDNSSLAASILNARAMAYQSTGDNADAISSIDRSLNILRDVNGLLTRARIGVLQSNSSDAMTYVNQALALAPNNSSALILKAELISAGDRKAALGIVDGVLKAHPNALNAIMVKIELLIELNRNDEAQQADDAVLSNNPDLPIATFYKALLLGINNKPLDGWRIANTLQSAFIQSETRYATGAAQLASDSGQLESANSILTTYVGQHPKLVGPRMQLAALRLKMNLPNEALNDLAPLMDSKDPEVLEFIANTFVTLKRQNDALTYLRKADAAGSKNGGLKYHLAMVDLTQGNIPQGVQEMLAGIKMQPGNLNTPEDGIDLLLKQSQFVEAQAIADQAEKANPKSPAPPLFKGEILLAQGKKDDGLAALNLSLLRDPHYLPALYARAGVFMEQHKYADATKDWKQIQAQQPDKLLAYVKLAEIAASSNQSAQSIALLTEAISKKPKLIDTRIILARYQVSLKRYSDAEATLQAALQVSPNDPQALALFGEVQQHLEQQAASLGTNKILTENLQQSGAAQFMLANSLLQSGDEKGAIAALKRATELSPDVLQYCKPLIDLQIQSGDNDGAVATARGWGKSQKGPDAALLLAGTLARLKRFEEAESVIATSQKIKPDFRLALLDSQIARLRGNRARGISILKNWLTEHEGDIPVRQAYADTLMDINDNADALVQYEIILKSGNDIPEVLNDTAWLIRDTNPNRALSLAFKATQLQPSSPDFADTLGWLLWKKGDAQGALPVLEQAHATEPASGEISYHLALVLNALGRKADAKQVIQAALAKDKTFLDAADAKKLLQEL